ncbi:hypothetical protein NHX12_016494 [Muraenolepis orangiensis]|uniref:NACHT domain-containing protein n=1 Tax=Muraenolepis orangiensis TaxID=630683 RepID=A0A9Q0I1M9_9TELE|nr:hypothetical protein NHX12_016494 [Muraenolepis orangiensis]
MQKFRRVFEGIAKAGQSTDLNNFYTELFITERVSGEVNKEHEVRLIEPASRKLAKEETPIKPEDIFKPLPGKDQPSRTIMTTGVAGIGKTVLTHKFTLDWAEGKANQDIHFTLPFTFRELNLLKEKEFSLMELLHHFFIQTKGILRYDLFQVVFILDGLDECRLPMDFQNNPIWTDVTKSTSVDILLTNLIRGDLLPSARIWITTRPAAANQIPAECVDMVTEVRGFTDPQKEEYFRKRFREEPLASKIISHIKTSRSIHIIVGMRPVGHFVTTRRRIKLRPGRGQASDSTLDSTDCVALRKSRRLLGNLRPSRRHLSSTHQISAAKISVGPAGLEPRGRPPPTGGFAGCLRRAQLCELGALDAPLLFHSVGVPASRATP